MSRTADKHEQQNNLQNDLPELGMRYRKYAWRVQSRLRVWMSVSENYGIMVVETTLTSRDRVRLTGTAGRNHGLEWRCRQHAARTGGPGNEVGAFRRVIRAHVGDNLAR